MFFLDVDSKFNAILAIIQSQNVMVHLIVYL